MRGAARKLISQPRSEQDLRLLASFGRESGAYSYGRWTNFESIDSDRWVN